MLGASVFARTWFGRCVPVFPKKPLNALSRPLNNVKGWPVRAVYIVERVQPETVARSTRNPLNPGSTRWADKEIRIQNIYLRATCISRILVRVVRI